MVTLKIINRNGRPWTCDDTERALSAIQKARPDLEMWPSDISIDGAIETDGCVKLSLLLKPSR